MATSDIKRKSVAGLSRQCSAMAYAVFGLLTIACALSIAPSGAHAVQPDEILKDPQLEARARELSADLRCLVCQNQSIDDSDAALARDLRLLVRERLVAGDSNREVLDFLVARYGEFVLLKPVWGPHTFFLWLAPMLVLGLAIFLARRAIMNASGSGGRTPQVPEKAEPLSTDDEARLRKLLGPDTPGGGKTKDDIR